MWLLEAKIKAMIEAREVSFVPDAKGQSEFMAFMGSEDNGPVGQRVIKIEGSTAFIDVTGVLTQDPSFFAMLFGGGNTTYSEIRGALGIIENDPRVEDVVMNMNSPGGNMVGFFETAAAISSFSKPVKSRVSGLCASACFGLASQCDSIEATNIGAIFGSVGVLVDMEASSDIVTIASTNAPNKAPDVTTPEGVAVVRSQLDEMHEKFAGIIATGRGATLETVNANFGKGGTFMAENALARGMIDCIDDCGAKIKNSNLPEGRTLTQEPTMKNLQELQASHPELYAQAVSTGVTQERERVEAHLTMGEACGDMSICVEAIKGGEDLTNKLNAKYLAAQMNRTNTEERATDDLVAGEATAAPSSVAGDNLSEQAKFDAAFLTKLNTLTPEVK